MSPAIVEPVFVILLETMTAITDGIVAGGPELFPGRLVHVPPHVSMVVLLSKPLKLEGAAPLLSELFFAHCAPQKLTLVPAVWGVRLPMTKTPPVANGIRVLVMVQVPFGLSGALQVPADDPLPV